LSSASQPSLQGHLETSVREQSFANRPLHVAETGNEQEVGMLTARTSCRVFQDLTVTLISELPDTEVVLEADPKQLSTINTEMFVDEQEWRLYDAVETIKDRIVKFYQLDTVDNRSHSVLSCRTHASRRPGFYLYSVFLIMVRTIEV
jgi:hypothetical protein